MTELRHLGQVSDEAVEALDLVPAPAVDTIRLVANEFASLCPVTGQPDCAKLLFEYVPMNSMVETKSFKLWLRRWRDVGQFNEVIVATLAEDFMSQVEPAAVRVTGWFNPRGGVTVTAVSELGDAAQIKAAPAAPALGGWTR